MVIKGFLNYEIHTIWLLNCKNYELYLYITRLNKKRPVFLLAEAYYLSTRSKAEIRSDSTESWAKGMKLSGCDPGEARLRWAPDRLQASSERLLCVSSFE